MSMQDIKDLERNIEALKDIYWWIVGYLDAKGNPNSTSNENSFCIDHKIAIKNYLNKMQDMLIVMKKGVQNDL